MSLAFHSPRRRLPDAIINLMALLAPVNVHMFHAHSFISSVVVSKRWCKRSKHIFALLGKMKVRSAGILGWSTREYQKDVIAWEYTLPLNWKRHYRSALCYAVEERRLLLLLLPGTISEDVQIRWSHPPGISPLFDPTALHNDPMVDSFFKKYIKREV